MYAGASLSGLGDVALKDLFSQIISLRGQLAQMRNAHGIPDAYSLLAALSASGQTADYGQLSAAPSITQEVLGKSIQKFAEARHTMKRADYDAAIAKMKSQISQLSGATTPAPATGSPVDLVTAPPPSPLVSQPATVLPGQPQPPIATPAPVAPVQGGGTAPVIVTTPGGGGATYLPATPAAAASTDYMQYAPYALAAGVLFFALASRGKSNRKAA